VVLELEKTGLGLLVRKRGQLRRLAHAAEADTDIRTLEKSTRSVPSLPRHVVIRLPSAQVLRKQLRLPLAARSNLSEVLGFEIDRETPFQRDEVHWTYVVRGQDPRSGFLDVELILLPRSQVDTLVETLRASSLKPAGIEVDAGNITTLIPLGSCKRGQWLAAQKSLTPLATAASILAVLAGATPFALQQWEMSAVESRISELEPSAREAQTFRTDVGQVAAAIDFLSKERSTNGSALTALAAATRTLPDDSYLNALSLRAGRLTLNGRSPSAAQLIGVLAQSPAFREPAFEAPVTHDANTDLEAFTISVALVSKGAP
jgi:general secretion pathway protein L